MAKGPKPLRNWAAIDPLMRKGGVHQTPKQQSRPRLDWREALDDFEDWQGEMPEIINRNNNEGPQGPSSLHAI